MPEASVAWGSDGTLYYGLQAYAEGEEDEDMTSIALARTTDLGETWARTMVVDARAEPDPKSNNTGVFDVVVDASGDEDAIHVAYARDWGSAPEGHPLEDKEAAAVSVSADGGESFGEPINLNDHSDAIVTIGWQPYPLHFQTGFGRPFLAAANGVVMAVANGGPPSDNQPPDEVYEGSSARPIPWCWAVPPTRAAPGRSLSSPSRSTRPPVPTPAWGGLSRGALTAPSSSPTRQRPASRPPPGGPTSWSGDPPIWA